MLDVEDPEIMRKVTNSVEWSKKRLHSFREQRMAALREFSGHYYGEGGSPDRVPINLIHTFTQIYMRRLKVNRLKALVTTSNRQLAGHAAEYTIAINRKLEQIKPESAINTAGQEAMFLMGIAQVGVSDDQVFVDPIYFDDFIVDMSAKDWDSIGYIGHRFRPRLDWARENGAYDKKVREKLRSSPLFESGDGTESSETDSQRVAIQEGKADEYPERVNLIQLYMPDDKLLVTYPEGSVTAPLSVVEWDGPPNNPLGPYRKLGHVPVPGNLMPVAPTQLIRDLHWATNALGNKVIRQAERQKTLLLVPPAARKDGQKVVQHNDGDAVTVDNPDGIKEVSTGGANQTTLGMVTWTRNLASYLFGNADAVGGLAPSTDTVGQDSMLLQAAQSQVEEMQQNMLQFQAQICNDIAYWTLNDPLLDMKLTRPIPGTGLSFDFRFTPESVVGNFNEYDFDIDPYVAPVRTPQQRLQTLMGLFERIVLQLIPVMQQQGQQIDIEKLIKYAAQYADAPELLELITFTAGEAHSSPEDDQSPPMPPRVRSNGGRPSAGGKSPMQQFEQMMMGKMMESGAPVGA